MAPSEGLPLPWCGSAPPPLQGPGLPGALLEAWRPWTLRRCWARAARLASLREEAPGGWVSGMDVGSAAQRPSRSHQSLCSPGWGGGQRAMPARGHAGLPEVYVSDSVTGQCQASLLTPASRGTRPLLLLTSCPQGPREAWGLWAQPWGLGREGRGLEAWPSRVCKAACARRCVQNSQVRGVGRGCVWGWGAVVLAE